MYHFHISFYLIGSDRDIFDTVREMPPLEHFSHSFAESGTPDPALLSRADVILADMRGQDAGAALASLSAGMMPGAELIALADAGQVPALARGGDAVRDIWVMPMGGDELRFRFLRWQQGRRLAEDCRESLQLPDAAGGPPDTIWYRDGDGVDDSEKNRTLEMLFSGLDCGIVCHSLDGKRILSVNDAALKLLDYGSMEEMLEAGFFQVAQSVLDEDKPKLRECITSLKKAGESVSVEYRVRQRSGRLLHILGNIKLLEKDGELFYQRFLLDCTDQKQREEQRWNQKDQEVHYQEQMFELFATLLSDNVDDVYLMIDASSYKAEFVSPNIERVLGVPVKAFLSDPKAIGHAEYITGSEVDKEGIAALEPGMAMEPTETKRIHQKTGEEKWFRESVYCVSVQGAKKIVAYISDRTLERGAQNVLTEALEIAQVANRAKSAFLGSISHDIRTPMNAIMGFVTLLKEDADNPARVKEYTQKISAASQHLMGLINDVLDMNKIESGSAVLNIAPLNLADVIDEIGAIIRPQTRAKEQKFEISAALTHENLLGDKLRIGQILINILTNAVKYTPPGGRISLAVDELPQIVSNYSRIRFTVSDNGQGMSEEYQKVVFEPFSKEQGKAWHSLQGPGLGMAITKSLVDLMGGSIDVESRLGEGSVFTVELELRVQETEDDPGFWDKHSVKRILVADDDEAARLGIGRKMADTGVEMQFAVNGAQAIEMLRCAREEGRPYDLLLLDWKMPDLDGLATARLIRKNSADELPILLFTAYDWSEIEKDALEVGIRDFLSKPFFMSNFKDAVARVMDARQKKVSPPASTKSVFNGKHVMVVDDIDVNRIILVKILTTLGAQCDEAVNGQEAVEKFNASLPGEYDMILMDIMMPILNGYEATRAIRASRHPSAREIPIIAMSANAFVDDVREAIDSGMDAHMAKPLAIGHLEQLVQDVLDRRKQQRQNK